MTAEDVAQFAAFIGISARDAALFEQALTHGSHSGKNGPDYQRLEFLGDRVLGLVIAEALFVRFPQAKEGQLAARLNELVARETCAAVARQLGIAPYIRLGKQARDDGGRDSDNILGDVMESLIGAIYRDQGLESAREFILKAWDDRFDSVFKAPKHPKSALLEWAAAHRRKPPVYTLVDRSGPDHAPRFQVSVEIAKAGSATGDGSSKQEAETAAAAALLSLLDTKT